MSLCVRVASLSVALCVLAACSPLREDTARAAPERGAQLYATHCAACHQTPPKAAIIGPSLHDERARKSAAEVVRTIENPSPPMPKLYPGQLSHDDALAIAAYVETL